jgi:predicted transcriptional regulator
MKGQLGTLEDAVMVCIWRMNRPVTVRDVLVQLQRDRSIAYTTVMTVMHKVHGKGWLHRETDGRAHRYSAVATRAEYTAHLMRAAWTRGDTTAATIVAFHGLLTDEQRAAFREAVRTIGAAAGEAGPDAPDPPSGPRRAARE